MKSASFRRRALPARPVRAHRGMALVRPARAPAAVTIGLVGAGKGGAALLDLLLEWPDGSVAVVVDPRPDAPALLKARALGIPTAPHHLAVFAHPVDVVLEVTGRAAVLDDLLRAKPAQVEVIGAASLRFFWALLQSQVEAARQLRVQLDLTMALGSELDPKRQIAIATQKLAQACDVDRCGFLLLDETTGLVMPVTSQFATGKSNERLWNAFKRLGHLPLTDVPFVSEAIERRGPIEIEDPASSPLLPPGWADRFGVKSLLVLPIFRKNRPIGVCVFDYCRDPRRFTPEQTALGITLASQVALVLDNTHLRQRAEERAEKLTALGTLTEIITSARAREQVSREIAKAAVTLLGGKIAQVWVDDPALGVLRIQGAFGLDPALELSLLEFPEIPRGQGVIASVFHSRTAEYLIDVQEDSRWLNKRLARELGLHAFAAIPLMTEDRVAGALTILFEARRVFSPEERELMHLLAGQAAVAIENAKLLQELRARSGRLETLLQATCELSRIQPLESLLGRIAKACGDLLGSDSVGIRVLEGDDLVIAGSYGDAREAMPTPRIKVGESLSGIVAATGEPLVVWDPAHDPRLMPAHREAYRRGGYRAWLGAPIKLGEQLIGVVSLRSRREAGFSPEDLTIATAFASQAAVALENSRLYQEIRHAYDELTEIQDQLTQAQKMEAVGRLAGGIAHDFNNLLTVILGRTELLLHPLKPVDPLHRSIELIQKAAGRAADLTRQLLAFSRKQVLQPAVLNLNAVAFDMDQMLRRLIGEDIALITALDPALGRVKADPGQIEQVIMNLAVNARDAMPQGGRLTIETANVEIDGAYVRHHVGVRAGLHVMLAVSDTGVGIPPEVQAHIFEPFFTTKGPGQGTGLGLATIYGIVKQSGGSIEVYSEAGRGTTFKIYLPRVDEAGTTEGWQPVAQSRRGTETILLVEDEEWVRELARDILQADGYTVLDARHGGEALLICERHPGPIHLLMTDVVMPQMSGRELADRLAPLRPEMKVVYMSGYTEDAVVHHGGLHPGTAFLQKPFTPRTLARKVREVLDASPMAILSDGRPCDPPEVHE